MGKRDTLRHHQRPVALRRDHSDRPASLLQRLEPRIHFTVVPLPVVAAPACVPADHLSLHHAKKLPPQPPAPLSKVLDVPDYKWYYGCCPTALGMDLGYWDKNGFPDLIPGDNGDAMTQNVKDAIASPAHIISGHENRPGHYGGAGGLPQLAIVPPARAKPRLSGRLCAGD